MICFPHLRLAARNLNGRYAEATAQFHITCCVTYHGGIGQPYTWRFLNRLPDEARPRLSAGANVLLVRADIYAVYASLLSRQQSSESNVHAVQVHGAHEAPADASLVGDDESQDAVIIQHANGCSSARE